MSMSIADLQNAESRSISTALGVFNNCSRLTALWRYINFVLLLLLLNNSVLRSSFLNLSELGVGSRRRDPVEFHYVGAGRPKRPGAPYHSRITDRNNRKSVCRPQTCLIDSTSYRVSLSSNARR